MLGGSGGGSGGFPVAVLEVAIMLYSSIRSAPSIMSLKLAPCTLTWKKHGVYQLRQNVFFSYLQGKLL